MVVLSLNTSTTSSIASPVRTSPLPMYGHMLHQLTPVTSAILQSALTVRSIGMATQSIKNDPIANAMLKRISVKVVN